MRRAEGLLIKTQRKQRQVQQSHFIVKTFHSRQSSNLFFNTLRVISLPDLIYTIVHLSFIIYTLSYHLQPEAGGIVRDSSRPIAEHSPNLDLLRQNIQHGIHISIIVDH